MLNSPVKLQFDWPKAIGGVAHTRYCLCVTCLLFCSLNPVIWKRNLTPLGANYFLSEETQADLSLLWAHMSEGTFSHVTSNHYENKPIQIYWKFYYQKNENFQIKILMFFFFLLKNTDCGYSLEPPRRGGSNEYPQSMFWAEIRKIIYTPVNPTFTI